MSISLAELKEKSVTDLAKIAKEKALNDALNAEVKAACEEFKPTFVVEKPQAAQPQPQNPAAQKPA